MLREESANARRSDPSTSHEAADAITRELNYLQSTVLAFAKSRGRQGFTDRELQDMLGDQGATYRTRRRELADKKLIVDTGYRIRHAGEARRRIVWRIAEPDEVMQ